SLGIKIARQGKVGPLITKGGLKSHGHNLPIGLKSGTVGSAVEIAKRGAHLAADTKSGIEWAARTQTRQQEVGIGIFGVRITDGDDFASALQEDLVGTLAAIATVDFGFPVATERRVENAA